jgi:hypothetical protein
MTFASSAAASQEAASSGNRWWPSTPRSAIRKFQEKPAGCTSSTAAAPDRKLAILGVCAA